MRGKTREPAEAARILGRRRIVGITAAMFLVAVFFGAVAAYLLYEVASGEQGPWLLAALPTPVSMAVYFGLVSYGGAYFLMNGRRPASAERVGRVMAKLNSNL